MSGIKYDSILGNLREQDGQTTSGVSGTAGTSGIGSSGSSGISSTNGSSGVSGINPMFRYHWSSTYADTGALYRDSSYIYINKIDDTSHDDSYVWSNVKTNDLIQISDRQGINYMICVAGSDATLISNYYQFAFMEISIVGSFSEGDPLSIMWVHSGFNVYGTQTTLTGSTTGSAIFSQPFQQSTFKKVIIYCNDLSGFCTYTYPISFTYIPQILSQNYTSIVSNITTTSITLLGTGNSGFITLEGY